MVKNKFFLTALFGIWSSVSLAQIEVGSLPEISVGTVGLPTVFTSDIWKETPDVDAVLSAIKPLGRAKLDSFEREILRQVLLTDAAGVPAFEKKNAEFLIGRLEVLLEQGLFEDVLELINQIPVAQQSSDVRSYYAKALYGLGRIQELCSEDFVSILSDDYIRLVCAYETKSFDDAFLVYEVYQEQNSRPFIKAAGDVIFNGELKEMPDEVPDILELPMVASAFGDKIFDQELSRGELRTLMLSDKIPDEIKEKANALMDGVSPSKVSAKDVLLGLLKYAEARQNLIPYLPEDLLKRIKK